MVMFTFSIFDRKYPFWVNFVQQIKFVSLSRNLVFRLIWIWKRIHMVAGMKFSYLAGKCVFYRPEHNAKGETPTSWILRVLKCKNEIYHIISKLWLIFCCQQQKTRKMSHFVHSSDYKSVHKHDNQTNYPILFLHFKTFKV